jgi:hypothetical protein
MVPWRHVVLLDDGEMLFEQAADRQVLEPPDVGFHPELGRHEKPNQREK